MTENSVVVRVREGNTTVGLSGVVIVPQFEGGRKINL
jgi:hypothetical protein